MSSPTVSDKTSDAAAAGRAARLRPLLASPCCLAGLVDREERLRCVACGESFPVVGGTPVLLREVPAGWAEKTDTKTRFARRSRWRRRLLNPDLTTKGHQRRRLREFLANLPPSALVMDVGSSLRRLSADILCLDLIPTPGVDLVGDLHRIPLAEGSIDAIICNGVLEHVENPELVVENLRRILKVGGRVYVSIPFLQGYHPSPTDFRRFTREGAEHLMSPFTIDAVVNTRGSASAVTWILSAFLAELVSFNQPKLYAAALALFGWLLLPLKYLDYLIAGNRFDHYITSGFTVIGTKPGPSGR